MWGGFDIFKYIIWTVKKLADIHSDLEEVGENFTQDRPRENALSGSLILKYFFTKAVFGVKWIILNEIHEKLEMQFNVSVKLEEISLALLKLFQKLKIDLVI